MRVLSNRSAIVYIIALFLAIVSYIYVEQSFSSNQLQIIRLTQIFAFLALAYLYVYLLIDPLLFFFKNSYLLHLLSLLRKELIISTLFFALLHSSYAFFGQLGGFSGLYFLSDYYLIGITLSFIALLIITIVAVVSFEHIVLKFKLNKAVLLYHLLYVSGILVMFHALLLGTHFHDLSEFLPFVVFIAVTFLFLLNAMHWDQLLSKSYPISPKFGLLSIFVLSSMILVYFWYVNPQSGNDSSSPLSVHSQHITTETKDNLSIQNNLYMPGMEGDKSKRFGISLSHSNPVVANRNVKLDFRISDASNGDPIYFFQTPFEKPFHLIVVNSDLSYFSHIHPEQEKNSFIIDTSFPQDDNYRLYTDFQPFGAIEQQYGFQLNVSSIEESLPKVPTVNFDLEKEVDQYKVSLSFSGTLVSEQISAGLQELKFTITDKDNNPVMNLHPYLGAFGHLVMIKKDTYEYVHAHPIMTKPVAQNERSGPNVAFIPMALYGKVTPGIYKVFGQFNPNGTLIVADFWIEVK